MMNVHCQILIRQAQEGNVDAFGELYAMHYRDMYTYALFVLRQDANAQDAVQEAALSALQQIGSLRNAAAFSNWLFRILANVCRRQLRARAEHPALSWDCLPTESLPVVADCALSVEMQHAIAALQPEEREILLLGVLGGYKSHEIASVLQCPAGTVRSKRKRTLEKLRVILTQDDTREAQ